MKGLELVFLATGSVLGALLRYKITEPPLLLGTIPVGVLAVNVAGAFILGMFVVLSQQWNLDGRYSLFAAVGFCGSLTTMSAFALDSSDLLEGGRYGALAVTVMANVGLSIAALLGGKHVAGAVSS
ncbi:MAG: CrcB family protein [Nitrosopumilus sp. H8]|nr:MAG: CrcB family protein [Nitrosopumilus sp. H8]